MNPIIEFRDVAFTYPGQGGNKKRVLCSLDLSIYPGEMVAIVGSNGSGKTTLLRHINGLLLPQSGKVIIDGLDTRSKENLGLVRQRVGMVFQFPEDQIVATTVAEDVAFGPENLGLHSTEIRKRVAEALAMVGLEDHANRAPHMLSGGQIQRLALAGVLVMRPKVVLFDEATTMLDPAGRRMALDWMLKLHRESMTVVYITHHMEEATLASRVIVLNEGQVVLDGTPVDVFSNAQILSRFGLGLPRPARFAVRFEPWLGKMVPRPLLPEDWLLRLPQYRPVPIQQKTMHKQNNKIASHEKLIEVHDLEHVYMADTPLAHMALNHLNLTGFYGSTLGLLGRTGSGKSTLLQHLNGLLRPQKGSVRVGPFVMEDPQTLTQSVAKLVGLVFQNPEMQFFEQYSGDEISFGPRQIDIEETLADRVSWAMKLAGLDFDAFKNRLVYTLSGGEKRKVALAATLAMRPKVLLLDEPTAGLDPAAHLEILGRLAALQSEGMTIVLSSHRMNDLAALSQRLAIFDKGRVIREGQTGDVFWDFNGLAKAGLEPPLIVQTVARLRELGWLLPIGIVTPDQLEIALQKCCQVPGQNEVTT